MGTFTKDKLLLYKLSMSYGWYFFIRRFCNKNVISILPCHVWCLGNVNKWGLRTNRVSISFITLFFSVCWKEQRYVLSLPCPTSWIVTSVSDRFWTVGLDFQVRIKSTKTVVSIRFFRSVSFPTCVDDGSSVFSEQKGTKIVGRKTTEDDRRTF